MFKDDENSQKEEYVNMTTDKPAYDIRKGECVITALVRIYGKDNVLVSEDEK